MGLIHQQDQIIQFREVLKIALAYIFAQALYARRLSPAHFGIDFRDVEDIDMDRAGIKQIPGSHPAACLIIIAGDDLWRIRGKCGNALKHVFGGVGSKVYEEFVVNSQVGSQNKKMPNPLGFIQIGDESAHQPGLSHTGR